MLYTKPSLSFGDQVKLLESRGLIINDQERAEHYLSNISYYRLSAYMLPFKEVGVDQFKPDVSFSTILDAYVFDRELRLLVFDAIERIEIAFRTQAIYQPAIVLGLFGMKIRTITSARMRWMSISIA
jgi:abortive infection bacteriophage resistance protein